MFGPDCPACPVHAREATGLDKAVWIDLLEPTHEEEKVAEKLIGTNIPTREEMLEIEPSSRLYEKNGVIFMTASVLYGVEDGKPSTDPISFILSDTHLVTLRYIDPKPFIAFADHAYSDPDLTQKPLTVLIRLLDALVDRLADEFERVGREVEAVSNHIFDRRARSERRSPELRYEALMLRIGEIQRLLARTRESSVSTSRMLGFLNACETIGENSAQMRHLQSLIADARALDDHSDFLADNLTFLLDAALGMISLEQNLVMKIFSVFAVVFMPPTLIAGIYGMNFEHMPELKWLFGYPMALIAIVASAVIPFMIARRKGWL
ncbi:magnesium transporter CorA family protein [Sphingomonas sp. LY160]|jgi:magnesium transporter|uniref:magnesium transporter CorA family protein n=1 Tax=Sphingomonas sp. LY160 TaxID=3095342 RepID=UPI002ADEC38E|nr:magnesium transporter CorA family protein [Sphingomonas sp. LY160]MEA1072698.1 magnesium transporter CorA family protein [Sphingomonas sp. LY160]